MHPGSTSPVSALRLCTRAARLPCLPCDYAPGQHVSCVCPATMHLGSTSPSCLHPLPLLSLLTAVSEISAGNHPLQQGS